MNNKQYVGSQGSHVVEPLSSSSDIEDSFVEINLDDSFVTAPVLGIEGVCLTAPVVMALQRNIRQDASLEISKRYIELGADSIVQDWNVHSSSLLSFSRFSGDTHINWPVKCNFSLTHLNLWREVPAILHNSLSSQALFDREPMFLQCMSVSTLEASIKKIISNSSVIIGFIQCMNNVITFIETPLQVVSERFKLTRWGEKFCESCHSLAVLPLLADLEHCNDFKVTNSTSSVLLRIHSSASCVSTLSIIYSSQLCYFSSILNWPGGEIKRCSQILSYDGFLVLQDGELIPICSNETIEATKRQHPNCDHIFACVFIQPIGINHLECFPYHYFDICNSLGNGTARELFFQLYLSLSSSIEANIDKKKEAVFPVVSTDPLMASYQEVCMKESDSSKQQAMENHLREMYMEMNLESIVLPLPPPTSSKVQSSLSLGYASLSADENNPRTKIVQRCKELGGNFSKSSIDFFGAIKTKMEGHIFQEKQAEDRKKSLVVQARSYVEDKILSPSSGSSLIDQCKNILPFRRGLSQMEAGEGQTLFRERHDLSTDSDEGEEMLTLRELELARLRKECSSLLSPLSQEDSDDGAASGARRKQR